MAGRIPRIPPIPPLRFWTELQAPEGHSLIAYSPVILGIFFAITDHLFKVFDCIKSGCSRDGLNLLTIGAIVLYILLQLSFLPFMLLVSKIVENLAGKVIPEGIVGIPQFLKYVLPSIISLIWGHYGVSLWWVYTKDIAKCLRKGDCSAAPYYAGILQTTDVFCGKDITTPCRDVFFQLDKILAFAISAFLNRLLASYWKTPNPNPAQQIPPNPPCMPRPGPAAPQPQPPIGRADIIRDELYRQINLILPRLCPGCRRLIQAAMDDARANLGNPVVVNVNIQVPCNSTGKRGRGRPSTKHSTTATPQGNSRVCNLRPRTPVSYKE